MQLCSSLPAIGSGAVSAPLMIDSRVRIGDSAVPSDQGTLIKPDEPQRASIRKLSDNCPESLEASIVASEYGARQAEEGT